MIAARLKGGLGNQLFQLSTAFAAAKANNDEFVIDYDIKHHSGQGHKHIKYKDNLYENLPEKSIKGDDLQIYNEPAFCYSPIPKYTGNIIIDGYFQSEKYFINYRDDVIKMFTFPDDIKDGARKKIDKIKSHFNREQTVCIHVRRGEYLKLQHIHIVQPKEYYLNAMEKFDKSKTVFIVISDDMDWCTVNLNYYKTAFCNTGYDYDTEPISTDLCELFDLHLASLCDHNIIPNSSFGWWGAWLNENKDKKVIAPSVWFGPGGPQDYHDMYCDGWEKM
jgi:hypothetical protein